MSAEVASSVELDDTQVNSTQVYVDYHNRITSFKSPSYAGQITLSPGEPLIQNIDNDNIHTYATGDIGHVNFTLDDDELRHDLQDDAMRDLHVDSDADLASSSQESGGQGSVAATSPPREYVAQIPTANQPPETPQLAGHKHTRAGHLITPSLRSPAPDLLAAFDMGMKPVGGLSQVFRNTQAGSSPMPAHLSDEVYDRPSPDVCHTQYSPAITISSPQLPLQEPKSRATTEPRDVYVPLQQSQEIRQRERAQVVADTSENEDEDEDFLQDSEERKAARRRQREQMLRPSFARPNERYKSIGHPSVEMAKARSFSASRPHIGSITPVVTKKRRELICLSDDTPKPPLRDVSDSDSLDEYDELGQTVVSSQREDETDIRSVQVPMTAIKPGMTREDAATPSQSPTREPPMAKVLIESMQVDCNVARTGTERPKPSSRFQELLKADEDCSLLSIADSQPPRATSQPDTTPSHPVLASSIDSHAFVSESQSISLPSNIIAGLSVTPLHPDIFLSSSPQRGPPSSSFPRRNAHSSDDDSPLSSPPKTPQAVPLLDKVGASGLPQTTNQNLEPSQPLTTNVLSETLDRSYHTAVHRTRQQHASQELNTTEEALNATPITLPIKRRLNYSVPDSSPAIPASSNEQVGIVEVSDELAVAVSEEAQTPQGSGTSAAPALSARTDAAAVFTTAPTQQSVSPCKRSPLKISSQVLPQSSEELSPRIPRFYSALEDCPVPDQSQTSGVVAFALDVLRDHDDGFQALVEERLSQSPRHCRVERSQAPTRTSMKAPQAGGSTPPLVTIDDDVISAGRLKYQDHHIRRSATEPPKKGVLAKPGSLRRVSRPNFALSDSEVNSATAPIEMRFEVLESPQPTSVVEGPTRVGSRSVMEIVPTLEDATGRPLSVVTPALESTENTTESGREEILPSTAAVPCLVQSHLAPHPPKSVAFPHRVLARFKGTSLAFWPSTCLGVSGSSSTTYKIRFDDGNIDMVDSALVRSFDIHVGDLVKVDLPGLRSKIYRVRGFKDRVDPADVREEFPKYDMHGNATVIVQARRRDSLPAHDLAEQAENLEVPISSIYVTNSMWINLKDRVYVPISETRADRGPSTPVPLISRPTTPSSRTRRQTINSTSAALLQSVVFHPDVAGLFSDMAFAITYAGSEEDEKNFVAGLIAKNGGRVLHQGLEELFDLPLSAPTSPSKSGRPVATNMQTELTLNAKAKKHTFAALIADGHSRRAKYMQALALNIPCLSGRWIVDCTEQQKLVPWDKYLLPAGESTYLYGAIRSRTFPAEPQYDLTNASGTLETTVANRLRLLHGKSVVLVMGKNKVEERRKAYLFLTLALGARWVGRVKDVESAKVLLHEESGWDCVCVEDAKVELARKQLLGLESSTGRRRKRNSGGGGFTDSSAAGNSVKVVGDEDIVQALILGSLVAL